MAFKLLEMAQRRWRRLVGAHLLNSLLVRGLRSKCHAGHEGSEDADHHENWCELVTRAIQGEWPVPTPSKWTREAEDGLGIHNKPYYFYALRAEEPYGLAVFVWREVDGLIWPAGARGATPFDSGDWWFGKIHADRQIDSKERRAAFQKWDVPLAEWQADFKLYIHAHYSTVGCYIKGCAPATGNQLPGNRFAIINEPPNTARAWTWEVRVPHDLIAERLALWKVYMTDASREIYLEYVDELYKLSHDSDDTPPADGDGTPPADSDRNSLDDGSRRRIHEWVEANVVTVPDKGASIVLAVNEAIAREVGDG